MKKISEKKKRNRSGSLLSVLGAGVNLILAGLKILAGSLSASAATVADGINNLSDALGFAVSFFGFYLASKPADRKHPYGHARMEYLSSLAISVMILFMGVELFRDSLEKILHPVAVETNLLFWGALIFSVLVKFILSVLFRFWGKRLSSESLKLSAIDSRNDVASTCGVLLSAVLGKKLDLPLDGAVGLGISIFIFVSGILQIKNTISPLLGEVNEKKRKAVLDCIPEGGGILGWHDLLIHDYGPGKCYASLHLEVDGDLDALACHEMMDEIERCCLEKTGVELIIHCDPAPKKSSEEEYLKEKLTGACAKIDPEIMIHDLALREKGKKKHLEFHVLLPTENKTEEKTVKKALEKEMEKEGVSSLTITFEKN